MTPERWRRVEELYHAALACDARDRARFLRDACAGDDALRRDVESLLAQPASAEAVLGEPAVVMAARLVSGPGPSIPVGHRIGGYQVQAALGAGGMGIVYRALDMKLNRPVAIKLLSDDLADAAARRRSRRRRQRRRQPGGARGQDESYLRHADHRRRHATSTCGMSGLISSISTRSVYGMSASANRTFMCLGVRPATGWIANFTVMLRFLS
jgi:hypothetical protein